MSFVRTKKQGNKEYLYEVENKREGDKVRQKVLRYLGPKKVHCDKKQIVCLIDLLDHIKDSDELKSVLLKKGIDYPNIDINKLLFMYDIESQDYEISYH